MATEVKKNTVALFSDKQQLSTTILASINKIKNHVSVRAASGKQLAHLTLKDEKSEQKLDALFADLEKLCIRDANYWITLPTGSWVRKNAILGYECHLSEKYQGLILRTQGNRILSFIPCDDLDTQLMIKQEIHKATAASSPSRRYKPTWDFYQTAV
ncbi:hypothetical protein V9654_003947 [Vibrio parahaemolyticus]|nr:hypothetical protein [Vibrio parahaemolyticus]EGR1737799.1 hypothetical protein [Vibrio parahaemolyticus]EHH2421353.1 hypothetical protein [Vibrio parahaemolyticus]EHR5764225.1 hypothetical protein [Vibrio parahaemolyticus]EIU6847312.1 hypothetical protein [Vibrio parahaemolyticus]